MLTLPQGGARQFSYFEKVSSGSLFFNFPMNMIPPLYLKMPELLAKFKG